VHCGELLSIDGAVVAYVNVVLHECLEETDVEVKEEIQINRKDISTNLSVLLSHAILYYCSYPNGFDGHEKWLASSN
jgi:hypothetical protein